MQEQIIRNLTGFDVFIHTGSEAIYGAIKLADVDMFLAKCVKIPSEGTAKMQMEREQETLKYRGKKLSINYCFIGEVQGLPEQAEDTWIIVSQVVFNSLFHIRKDLLMIDFTVKNQNGKVIACRSLTRSIYKHHNKTIQAAVMFLQENLGLLNFDKVSKTIVSLNKYLEK